MISEAAIKQINNISPRKYLLVKVNDVDDSMH